MQGIVFFCVVLGVVTKLPQTAFLNGPKQKKVTVNLANLYILRRVWACAMTLAMIQKENVCIASQVPQSFL